MLGGFACGFNRAVGVVDHVSGDFASSVDRSGDFVISVVRNNGNVLTNFECVSDLMIGNLECFFFNFLQVFVSFKEFIEFTIENLDSEECLFLPVTLTFVEGGLEFFCDGLECLNEEL